MSCWRPITLSSIAGLLFSMLACGNTDDTVCAPARAVACVGSGGCAGQQVCNPDGTGFSLCACTVGPDAGVDAGAPRPDAGPGDPDSGTPRPDAGPGNPDSGTPRPDTGIMSFPQPAGTTPVSFCVDDRANQTYGSDDGLVWKGSFTYNVVTRALTADPSWGGGLGPYPPVYDDGPWTSGGHEPVNEVAGDHRWCVTTFFPTPRADQSFEYGAESSVGWIWSGQNGTFVVGSGQTQEVVAPPLVIPAFGTIDLRLTLDTANLAPGWDFDPALHGIVVKGAFSGWTELEAVDTGLAGDVVAGDGVYSMVLSEHVGPSTSLPHTGLLHAGVDAEFILVVRGVECKGRVPGLIGSVALTDGVAAEIKTPPGDWTATPVRRNPGGDQNTMIRP